MLLLDNGPNFTAQVVTALSIFFVTYPKVTAPYHPATNGAAGRANATLVLILWKVAAFDPIHWPWFLLSTLLAYQISYHHAIGLSPFNSLYGHEPNIP